ncbi:MAG TPA: cytidine deaminase [Alphaproteobacteria bacterium]
MQTMTLPALSIPAKAVETPLGKLIYPGIDQPERMLIVDPAEIQSLVKAARQAAELAYSAYDVQFPVGAALIMRDDPDGLIFSAGNSENSVLNAGICAERAAIAYAIGQGFRQIKMIVVSTANREKDDIALRAPCGLCRQAIREFADDNTVIIVDHESDGILGEILDINRLFPYGYHYTPVTG